MSKYSTQFKSFLKKNIGDTVVYGNISLFQQRLDERERERERDWQNTTQNTVHPSNWWHWALAAFNPTAIPSSVSIHPSPLLSVAGLLKVTDTQYAKPDGQPHGRSVYHSVSTPLEQTFLPPPDGMSCLVLVPQGYCDGISLIPVPWVMCARLCTHFMLRLGACLSHKHSVWLSVCVARVSWAADLSPLATFGCCGSIWSSFTNNQPSLFKSWF